MLMLKEFVRNTSNDGCLVAKLQRRTYNYISKPVISSKKPLDVDFVTTVLANGYKINISRLFNKFYYQTVFYNSYYFVV